MSEVLNCKLCEQKLLLRASVLELYFPGLNEFDSTKIDVTYIVTALCFNNEPETGSPLSPGDLI